MAVIVRQMEQVAEFKDRSYIKMAMFASMSYALYIIRITCKALYMTIVILDCIALVLHSSKYTSLKK